MPHPYLTAELVRQRRAALAAASHNQQPPRQRPPRTRTAPEHGRFATRARTLAHHVHALVARAT
jgi:hypothetical protein